MFVTFETHPTMQELAELASLFTQGLNNIINVPILKAYTVLYCVPRSWTLSRLHPLSHAALKRHLSAPVSLVTHLVTSVDLKIRVRALQRTSGSSLWTLPAR